MQKIHHMHFISEELENYVALHSENEPEILQRLNKETHQKILQPRMLSGHFQGRVLSMLSKIINPKHILELGTYTGYATLCLAEGLQTDGTIDTIDINEELEEIQEKYFNSSDYKGRIFQHIGDAIEIIPTLNKKFDLVFIDADKENYLTYLELIKPRLRSGGIILIDNVLWYGKVLDENPTNKATQQIKLVNDIVAKDPDFENVILPIRDGIHLIRKK